MKSLDKQLIYYSYGVAMFAARARNENHEKRREHFYVWRIILVSIFQTTILLLAGFLLKIPNQMFLAMASFASLRLFAGGYHVDSSKHGARDCTLTSLTIMLVSVYGGKLINLHLSIIMFIIGFILLLILSPADDKNRPIITAKTRVTNKILSIIIFFIWIAAIYFYPVYIGVITVSIFLECLSLLSKSFSAAQHIKIHTKEDIS